MPTTPLILILISELAETDLPPSPRACARARALSLSLMDAVERTLRKNGVRDPLAEGLDLLYRVTLHCVSFRRTRVTSGHPQSHGGRRRPYRRRTPPLLRTRAQLTTTYQPIAFSKCYVYRIECNFRVIKMPTHSEDKCAADDHLLLTALSFCPPPPPGSAPASSAGLRGLAAHESRCFT